MRRAGGALRRARPPQLRRARARLAQARNAQAGATPAGSTQTRNEQGEPTPVGPPVLDDTQVQLALELAIRIGEVLLSSGESAADTTSAMLRVASACGLSNCDVDITFTSITMCCHRGVEAGPVTSMRLVRYRSLDLSRLTDVADLVRRIEHDRIGTRDAVTELAGITSADHPYPRWVATLAWATLAASVSVLLGGGPVVAAVAFGATAVVDRVGRLLNRANLPFIFQQLVGASLATGVTAALLGLDVLPPGIRPSLVVAAALTVLLSGSSVVGAVRDAIDGYFLTATARAMEVAMYSAGLLAGVVLTLKAVAEFDIRLEVATQIAGADGLTPIRLLAAALTAAMFALAGYSPMRFLPAAAGTGLIGWTVYAGMLAAHFGPVVATGAGAVCVGVATSLLHRWASVPRLLTTLAAIVPLLPGLTAYRGFYELGVNGGVNGLVTITVALAIGLALAGGVALGEWVVDRTPRPRPRRARIVSPAPSGPGQ
jgi:uncharacterized membrane protein YjjP (DUF1212 family)